jgi:hypothetical protein
MNDFRNRLRFKVFSSFTIAALGIAMIVRLWGVAPPSAHMAPAYATAAILSAAAFWRGIIFARAARLGSNP